MTRVHYRCRRFVRSLWRDAGLATINEFSRNDRQAIRVFRSTEVDERSGTTVTATRVYGFFKIASTAAIESTIRPLFSEAAGADAKFGAGTTWSFIRAWPTPGGGPTGDIIVARWLEALSPAAASAAHLPTVCCQIGDFEPCSFGPNAGLFIERNAVNPASLHSTNGPTGFATVQIGRNISATYSILNLFQQGGTGDFCLDHEPVVVT